MKTHYKPNGVCPRSIGIEIDQGLIKAVQFDERACSGNTQGVVSLIQDQPADQVIAKLKGIRCGNKKSSCVDQLALAIEDNLRQQK